MAHFPSTTDFPIVKGKAIPATGRGGPFGCEKLRLPYFLNKRLTDGADAVSLMCKMPPPPSQRLLVLTPVKRISQPQGHAYL
jgi:hypothetical protein